MTQATKSIDQVWESKCNMVLSTCIERVKDILDSFYIMGMQNTINSFYNIERDTETIEEEYAKLDSYIQDIKEILDGAFSHIHTLLDKTINISSGDEDADCDTMECIAIICNDEGLIGISGNNDSMLPVMHVHDLADLTINGNLDIVIGGTRYCLSIVK